jgi:hypothetical protein
LTGNRGCGILEAQTGHIQNKEDEMKFDMTTGLTGFNGDPIKKSEDDDSPVTLGETLSMACVNASPQKYTDGPAKLKIYRVLQKIGVKDIVEVELEAEEITLLKELVGSMYGVVVVGAVEDLLEQRH